MGYNHNMNNGDRDVKTFEFTIEEIRRIFEAGVRHGEDVQSSHDWGTTPQNNANQEIISVLQDILYDRRREEHPDAYDTWPEEQEIKVYYGV
jgi:hypothetical protein